MFLRRLFDWDTLPELARRTLGRQIPAAHIDGLSQAGTSLIATIAAKSLGANDLHIMLLMMVAPVCFLLSIYWAELIARLRRWNRLFLLCAFAGVAPLALMYAWGSMRLLLLLLLLYEFHNSLNIPLRNRIMQANYPRERRSFLYGRLASLTALTILLVSYPLGHFLDAGSENWRWVFAAIALFGVLERILQFSVPVDEHREAAVLGSPRWMGLALPHWRRLHQPILRMGSLLNRNRAFFRWEMQFMLYGLAFFMVGTVQPGYLVTGLGLSYAMISLGQVAAFRLSSIFSLPYLGAHHDRLDPASFCARIFGLLAFFPLLLASCSLVPEGPLRNALFLASFLLQGIAMSGVAVAWSMSSLVFAGKESAATYQGIHVTLTGLRGLVGPLLGWFVRNTFGWHATFACATCLLILAAWLMYRQGLSLREMLLQDEAPATG